MKIQGKITISHGDGGKHTQDLIKHIFFKHFNNPVLLTGKDAAVFPIKSYKLAFTTDSFIVNPLFFRGGDIGKLAVCGTVNDLVAEGADPVYLSTGFIIEEGFEIKSLEKIVASMSKQCMQIGVKVITGDTKVVPNGELDGLYINTTGIGIVVQEYQPKPLQKGDKVIITGSIAEHGAAIALSQYDISVDGNLVSDCAPLQDIVRKMGKSFRYVKTMTDPTRGGIATVLNEIAYRQKVEIQLYEDEIPVRQEVEGVCQLLGIDPLYLACEGRMIIIVENFKSEEVLRNLRTIECCKNAKIIGEVVSDKGPLVYLKTNIGGKRILTMLEGKMLPRIC